MKSFEVNKKCEKCYFYGKIESNKIFVFYILKLNQQKKCWF